MKDQVNKFTNYHKRDEELISTKSNEAKMLGDESRVFKQLYEEIKN